MGAPGTGRLGSDTARYAGLGLQLALTMAVLGLLGWWLDGKLGTFPWLMVAGIAAGAVGGTISIVKAVPPPSGRGPGREDPWKRPNDPAKRPEDNSKQP